MHGTAGTTKQAGWWIKGAVETIQIIKKSISDLTEEVVGQAITQENETKDDREDEEDLLSWDGNETDDQEWDIVQEGVNDQGALRTVEHQSSGVNQATFFIWQEGHLMKAH